MFDTQTTVWIKREGIAYEFATELPSIDAVKTWTETLYAMHKPCAVFTVTEDWPNDPRNFEVSVLTGEVAEEYD